MSRRPAILERVDFDPMPLQSQLQASELAAKNNELQQQLAAQKQQRLAAQKEQRAKDATAFIDGLNIAHSGLNPVDVTTDKQIQALQGKLMEMQANGADVSAIRMEAQKQLPAIVNTNTAARNKYAEINKSIGELAKDYPSGDAESAKKIAVNSMLNDFYSLDKDGNYIPKDISTIPIDKNYTQSLSSDENLPLWYKPSGGLEQHIQSLPKTTLGGSEKYRDKNGVERDVSISGVGTVFSQPVKDANGNTIGKEIKYEEVPTGKNQDGSIAKVKILPKEEFDLMLHTPLAKADFLMMFNKHLDEMGVDPSSLNPIAKDVLQRQYARDWLERTNVDGSSLYTHKVEKQPIPKNITNIRVNTGKEPDQAIDVYKTIDEKATDHLNTDKYKPVDINGMRVTGVLQANILDDNEQGVILEKANKANPNSKLGIDDIYVKKFPDGIWIIRAEDNVPLTKLTPTGTNVTANQPLGVKSKQEAVRQAKGNQQKPVSAKTFNVIDPNTGKVVLSNVDENAANKARSKGYKIQ